MIDWSGYLGSLAGTRPFYDIKSFYVPPAVTLDEATASVLGRPRVTVTRLLRSCRRVAVVGEPGAGKSWILRYQALLESDVRRRVTSHRLRLPIYTELKDWHFSLRASANSRGDRQLLLQFLAESVTAVANVIHGASSLPQMIEAEIAAAPFLLLFDGLDEIRDAESRSLFARSLLDLLTSMPKATTSCVVSARKYGFSGPARDVLIDGGFRVAEIGRPSARFRNEVLRRYLPRGADPKGCEAAIRRDYRTSRLCNNVFLLSRVAIDWGSSASVFGTRGEILRSAVENQLSRFDPLVRDLLRDTLCSFARRLWDYQRRTLLTATEVLPLLDSLAGRNPIVRTYGPLGFLDLLCTTGLVDQQARPSSEFFFVLPQWEDYFLALTVLDELKNHLKNASRSEITALQAVRDSEWHHVLIVATGMLNPAEVEMLVASLSSKSRLMLKARILGECRAPTAEREFAQFVIRRIGRAVDVAGLCLPGTSLFLLVGYGAGLPVVLATLLLERSAHYSFLLTVLYVAVATGLWIVGIRVVTQILHPWLYGFFVRRLRARSIPEGLAPLTYLGIGSAARGLRSYSQQLNARIRSSRCPEDPSLALLREVARLLNAAAALCGQNPDTIQSEMEANPGFIEVWLRIRTGEITDKDIQVLLGFLVGRAGKVADRIRCLRKLEEVAVKHSVHRMVIQRKLQELSGALANDRGLCGEYRRIMARIQRPPKEHRTVRIVFRARRAVGSKPLLMFIAVAVAAISLRSPVLTSVMLAVAIIVNLLDFWRYLGKASGRDR